MDVKGEKLVISQDDRNEKGQQIDPEERIGERQTITSIPITLNNGQSVEEFTGGAATGEKDITIRATGNAVEFATGYRDQCRFCRHCDVAWFRRWKHDVQVSADPERSKVLNFLRGKILGSVDPEVIGKHPTTEGDLDVEHALNEFGICHALSSEFKDMVFVYPDAGCPLNMPDGTPCPSFFKPRDTQAAQAGTTGYDNILKAAQGGSPKRKATRVPITLFKK